MADGYGWVEAHRYQGAAIAAVFGEIDMSNVSEIQNELDAVMETGDTRHYLDLAHTTYFDSAGIRMLFALAERYRSRRHELRLIVPEDGVVRRVLELSGLTKVVPLHRSRSEAVLDVSGS